MLSVDLILFDFSVNFEYLFENFNVNMTLKVHIILHHYKDNFDMTQKSMRFTNGEFVESTHYSIKNEERTHNFKVKRMMGTPIHLEKSKKSLVWHNSRRLGMTPPEKLRLRRSVHSPINILINNSFFLYTNVVFTVKGGWLLHTQCDVKIWDQNTSHVKI